MQFRQSIASTFQDKGLRTFHVHGNAPRDDSCSLHETIDGRLRRIVRPLRNLSKAVLQQEFIVKCRSGPAVPLPQVMVRLWRAEYGLIGHKTAKRGFRS